MEEMLSIILISCLGIAAYSNTFYSSFHFDDFIYVFGNHSITNVHNLLNIWSFYPARFVTFLSFALNYHLHQFDVLGFHLFNLGVHLGSAILVWWLVLLTLSTPAMKEEKITTHSNLIALLAGLVFVSHPLQTEAVTYICQRSASMAALFYLASLCFYIRSRLLNDSKLYYACSLSMAFTAMFTRENAITLPLMILLYEVYFLKAKRSSDWPSCRTLVVTRRRIIPFLLTLFIIPLTMLLTKSGRFREIQDTVQGPNGISPIQYLLTEFRVMVTYIRLVIFPLNQNLDYDYHISKSIFELPCLLSCLLLMGILISAQRLFSRYRLVSFSIFWFFLTLLPESSLLPARDVIFEHRLYLPIAGYSIFLVSGMYYLWGKNNIKWMAIALMVIACNGLLTYQRNKIWKDEVTLWNDVIRKSPYKARPYNGRGLVYIHQGKFTQAVADYNKAIEVNPNDAESYYNRGSTYYQQGMFIQAISDYNKVIEINPNVAEGYYQYVTGAYDRLGVIYSRQGDVTQALSDYNKAIGINPNDVQSYNNRAVSYYLLKEYREAWADVHKTEELGGVVNPEFISALKKASDKAQ